MTAFPLPSLFVSHGAPSLALEPGVTGPALARLAGALPRPRAVLAVSAHHDTLAPQVGAAPHPETIHDFGGFAPELYEMRYPAPGLPALADEVLDALRSAGIAATIDPQRGLDHGTWVPLMFMYPDADVPVVPLSIQSRLGPAHHLRLGRALAPLTHAGVLVLATGSITHNLRELDRTGGRTPEWVEAFRSWIAQRIEAGDVEALLDYRARAPHAARNHPTDEHLLPLFVALGAAGAAPAARRVHADVTFGVLGMDAYAFGANARGLALRPDGGAPALVSA